MDGRRGASERRTFAAAVTLVAGAVVAMLLLAPGDDLHAALLADLRDDAASPAAPPPPAVRVHDRQESLREPERHVLAELLGEATDMVLPDDPRLPGWVEDLRDDGVPDNAGAAMWRLVEVAPGEIAELERALGSHDPQLRHFAAGVLRIRVEEGRAQPSDRLFEVSVQALRSDLGAVEDDALGTYVYPLTPRAARFLAEHAEAGRRWLEQGFFSGDAQQRFLSAYLLTQAGAGQHVGPVAYELIEHLRDNDIVGDAAMAAHGLFCLGESAAAALDVNRRYLDGQGRDLVDLIRLDLVRLPRTQREFYDRAALAQVSPIYHDVAVQYRIDRSVVPQFSR